MLGRTVGILCAACAGASALLLPPGVASNDDASDLSVSILNPKKWTLTVPCFECAFPMGPAEEEMAEEAEGEDMVWIQGGANSLLMYFEVSEDSKTLHLNGVPIYPVFSQNGETIFDQKPIHIKQVPSNGGLVDIKSGKSQSADLEVTAYGLKQKDIASVLDGGDRIVPLTLEIMGLNDQFIHVDEVALTLLQTREGELLILEAGVLPTQENTITIDSPSIPSMPEPAGLSGPHHFQQGPIKECNLLPAPLCKLKSIIEDNIDAAMGFHAHGVRKGGCHGRKGGFREGEEVPHGTHLPTHIKGPHLDQTEDFKNFMDGDDAPRRPHHGRPHHVRPHSEHHRHHHGFFSAHHFLHAFLKGLVAVLIPVMAGITVGMTVSLIGLIVGRLIGFIWIHVARGGRRGSAFVALTDEPLVGEGEDKAMLAEMDAEEALPVYEDAPAYVEIAEKDAQ